MAVIQFRAALQTGLPARRLDRLVQVQQLAASLGAPTYLVGGVARDLLLERRPGDLDLVVQASDDQDALAGPRLAHALARRFGGQVTVHKAFGTSTWLGSDGEAIDIATARTETYAHPGALPTVTPAPSILADLSRRDFTINAMAIRVDGELFGEVLDPYQGQDDLFARQVRVLHAQSFQDDPTRLFRAARYEQRLGFELARETMAQVPAGLATVPVLSGERVRHELELIFREPLAPAMLGRLAGLGALAAASPALRWGDGQAARAQLIPSLPPPEWRLAEPLDPASLYLALLLDGAEPDLAQAALLRLSASRRLAEAVSSALSLQLESELPSQVVAALEPLSLEALTAAYVLRPALRARLSEYLARWRFIEAELNGDDLLALGLPPGPNFARWLRGLRAARLDGRVSDRDGELSLLRAWSQME
jgi:tRNA nucleotidyltransferase (CCA-adding enzyme)